MRLDETKFVRQEELPLENAIALPYNNMATLQDKLLRQRIDCSYNGYSIFQDFVLYPVIMTSSGSLQDYVKPAVGYRY